MSTARLLADAFAAPARALPVAAARGRALPPIAVATAAALALAAVVAARGDWEGPAAARVDAAAIEKAPSPAEREEKIAQAVKLARTAGWAGALFLPGLSAVAAGLALAGAFRLAGARPSVRGSLSAAAFGLLPLAARDLATVPAVLRHAPVRPADVPGLLPSSLAALFPPGAEGPLVRAASAADLFSLWSVALVELGMAAAAEVPRRRALAVTALLFVAAAAVLRVALPALLAPAPR